MQCHFAVARISWWVCRFPPRQGCQPSAVMPRSAVQDRPASMTWPQPMRAANRASHCLQFIRWQLRRLPVASDHAAAVPLVYVLLRHLSSSSSPPSNPRQRPAQRRAASTASASVTAPRTISSVMRSTIVTSAAIILMIALTTVDVAQAQGCCGDNPNAALNLRGLSGSVRPEIAHGRSTPVVTAGPCSRRGRVSKW